LATRPHKYKKEKEQKKKCPKGYKLKVVPHSAARQGDDSLPEGLGGRKGFAGLQNEGTKNKRRAPYWVKKTLPGGQPERNQGKSLRGNCWIRQRILPDLDGGGKKCKFFQDLPTWKRQVFRLEDLCRIRTRVRSKNFRLRTNHYGNIRQRKPNPEGGKKSPPGRSRGLMGDRRRRRANGKKI